MTFDAIQQSNKSISDEAIHLAEVASQSFLYSAIQSPIDGVSQLVNKIADRNVVPDPKLIAPPEPAEFGSGSWVAETVGSGLGMVAPFMLTERVASAAVDQTARLTAGTLEAKSAMLASSEVSAAEQLATGMKGKNAVAKMTVAGAMYGMVLTPSVDPNRDFWEQRGISAATSAITFGAMGLTSKTLLDAAEAKSIGARIGVNAASGAVGGITNAESTSIFSGTGPATQEQIVHSVASYMLTGIGLDAAHLAAEKAGTLIAANKSSEGKAVSSEKPNLTPEQVQMLDKIERAHFEYFRQESDPITGLTKDRSTPDSPSSIAAVGFSLTAHPVTVSRGWISRDEAVDYTLKVLKNLSSTPQGDQGNGVSGNHGFFYHFLDPKTGLRQGTNELSTVDTALLMGGVLFSKNYFDGTSPKEVEIRALADNLYKRVDWPWALNSEGRLSMGWTPEHGFIPADWQAYNEAQILLLLGMGSPTHPLPASAWEKFMSTSKVVEMNGQKSLEFGPMFGHQYTQIWMDYRGIKDATNQKMGFDYFENSRRAAQAQHQYAIDNPNKWRGYGNLDWGLTASDGPGDVVKDIGGKKVEFKSYNARGFPNAPDDGTIAPTAAAASIAFVPELVLPTLKHWTTTRSEIFGPLGFQDAFNPTFDQTKPSGWIDSDTLGIDQGPILLMTENFRSGFIWNMMKNEQYLKDALQKAGFKPDPVTTPSK